jgi:hypothetical protein
MNAKAYPEGAMTPQNARELREQRQAVEFEKRRRSDEAKAQGLAQARRAREVQDRKNAERAAVLAPFEKEQARLTELVKRAAEQLQHAEQKSEDSPLDTSLASEQLAAEKCLVRLQLRLDDHEKVKP